MADRLKDRKAVITGDMESISWSDFERVEFRVSTIQLVEDLPEARKPTYKINADFGPEISVKQSSAQITALPKADKWYATKVR